MITDLPTPEPSEPVTSPLPRNTGPEAIADYLRNLDMDALVEEQKKILKSGSKTARSRAIKILNIAEGFKRNNVSPVDLIATKVPVIPVKFRPFSRQGDTFVPGDSNELYRSLMQFKDVYSKSEQAFGKDGASDAYLDMNDAAKALWGFGDSPDPAVKARDVNGFFRHVTGVNGPKTSFVQKKLVSKTQDFSARGVLTFDADLGMDEASIPDDMAWSVFKPHVQRRLVQGGMHSSEAIKAITERTPTAGKALDEEMKVRPIVYARSPSWHKFNKVGAWAKRHDGNDVRINVFTAEGLSGDADGDTLNIHVPVGRKAIEDVKERIMPSKMIHSVKSFDRTYGTPKHEQILGLYSTKLEAPKATHHFRTKEEFKKAMEAGTVDLSDAVSIGEW